TLLFVFCLRFRRPPGSTLFPYTTLFRSFSVVFNAGEFFNFRNILVNIIYVFQKNINTSNIRFFHIQNTARMVDITDDELVINHRSEEHTSELQSRENLVCRLLLEKKKKN